MASQTGWVWPESLWRSWAWEECVRVRVHTCMCTLGGVGGVSGWEGAVCVEFSRERGRVFPAGDENSWSGCGKRVLSRGELVRPQG